jgi:hypothetical protein
VIETPLLRGPLQEIIAKPQRKKEKRTPLLDSDIEDNSDSDDEEEEKPGSTKFTARTIVPDHLPAFPSKHSYKQTPVRSEGKRGFILNLLKLNWVLLVILTSTHNVQ